MILNSYAKINLYLNVLGKRRDGYHNIHSIFQSISLHDEMRIEENEGNKVIFNSNDPSLKWNEDNLIFKAYDLFFREFEFRRIGLKIYLKKRIPKGCGFGGGSSNAALMLLYLGKKFGMSLKYLEKIAIALGSDVKYFLHGGTALVKGRGDEVKLLEDIEDYSVNLKIPNLSFETSKMYSEISKIIGKIKVKANPDELFRALKSKDTISIKENVFNIFEHIILRDHPELINTLNDSSGIVSSFTGKGPAVFILHDRMIGRYRFVTRDEFRQIESFQCM